jgi:alpha-mannosidase
MTQGDHREHLGRRCTRDKLEGPISPDRDSFLTIDNPNVVLIAWKLAEDGDGSIVRMEEIAGQTEQIVLRPSHLHVVRARQCTLREDSAEEIPVTGNAIHLTTKTFEILTVA